MADGRLPDVRQQKGHQRASDPTHDRRFVQIDVVHDALQTKANSPVVSAAQARLSKLTKPMSSVNRRTPKTTLRRELSRFRLVERDGSVRWFRVPNVSATTLRQIIVSHINRATYIMADDAPVYTAIGRVRRPRVRQPAESR
jgi:hypothetical protein